MIPKECKRLAEVDLPIATISKHSAREKSIRHGHPSTIHLWWARRPLAACRAVLLGLLLPDPCDENCPAEFKTRARNILPRIQGHPASSDQDLRHELLRFIGDFANYDNATNTMFIDAAQGLVRAAHGEDAPVVVDSFAGGGSIPLEALRLGCEGIANDLNPVACLILKTLLDDTPRFNGTLGETIRSLGKQVLSTVNSEMSRYYPSLRSSHTPIAYIWARTVICDSCGADIPLVRGLWLSKKPNRKRALQYRVVRPKSSPPRV